MDKIILLKRHMKTFYIFENNQTFEDGEIVGDTTVKEFIGALFPLSLSDLQRLDRGDVSFTDKKIYTKAEFKNGDQLVDGNSSDGYKWLVKAKIDYDYQADMNIYVIGGTE